MAPAPTSLVMVFTALVIATAVLVFSLVRRAYLGRDGELRPQTAVFRMFFTLGLWMAITAALASSGVLADFAERPPPMMVLMGFVFVASVALAFSPFGTQLARGLPLAWLIGFQGFRLPLELVMHWAAEEGVMPVQMSYEGRNPDILTGVTAIFVAWMLMKGWGTRRTPWLWNILGTGLLINILVVAILSLPTFARWGPDQVNLWITHTPFVWLPTVLVPFALIGHLLLWRRLLGNYDEG
ncbi:MAG: hypothetical protein AAF997_05780 [Myxococcota bacterium]